MRRVPACRVNNFTLRVYLLMTTYRFSRVMIGAKRSQWTLLQVFFWKRMDIYSFVWQWTKDICRIHRYSGLLLIWELESNWIIEIQVRIMILFKSKRERERERENSISVYGALIVSQSQFPTVINYFAQFRETMRCKLIGIYLNARGCLWNVRYVMSQVRTHNRDTGALRNTLARTPSAVWITI